jgi:hypothetical protein
MNSKCFAAPLLFLAACCLLPGCNRSDRPATYPVRGTVTYREKPVAGATVAFLAPGAPRPATATTDEAGNFHLTTYEPNDGAIAGTHVVTVRKYSSEPSPVPQAEPSADAEIDPAAVERSMAESARWLETARSLVPAKYADRKTSDLRLEVAEGQNEFTIELVD